MGLRPYLDPTRERFSARKRKQPTTPKIRAADLLGKLSLSSPPTSFSRQGPAAARRLHGSKDPPPVRGGSSPRPRSPAPAVAAARA